MDSTTALSYGSPFLDSDPPMSNTSSSSSIFALSNPPPGPCGTSPPRSGEAERGERAQYQARVPGPPGGMAGNAPVRQADEQARVCPLAADAHVRQVTGQVGARLVAVELAVEDVREPGLVNPRPVRFGPLARIRTRHALFAHDVADAPPGRDDANSTPTIFCLVIPTRGIANYLEEDLV